MESSKVFMPPSQLQVPDTPVTHSDSAFSMPESDLSSDESSSPTYSQEQVRPPEGGPGQDPPTVKNCDRHVTIHCETEDISIQRLVFQWSHHIQLIMI